MASLRRCYIAVALGLFTGTANVALASSCNREIFERIRFQKAAKCWYYAGNATHFTGRFLRGQRVTVEMSGESWSAADDQDSPKPEWTARTPYLAGPHDFHAYAEENPDDAPPGKLQTALPETGQYTFGFGPCSMTTLYGHVTICASAPP
jgi:hypothetical protein